MKKRTHGAMRSPRPAASASTRAYMSISSFFPAVHEPAYAMSTLIRSATSSMYRPFPGSPGSAIIGRMAAASISITSQYSAAASLSSPAQLLGLGTGHLAVVHEVRDGLRIG